MNPTNRLTLRKWPFFLADGFFVAAAGLAFWFAAEPPGAFTGAAVILLLLAGALVSLTPYLVEFYWNCQQAGADREEQLDLQRQSLSKTGQEILQLVRRLEEMKEHRAPDAEPSAEMDRQIEEMALGFQQWQARLEEKEERLAVGVEKLLREEQKNRKKDREHFDQVLAELRGIPEQLESVLAQISHGGFVPAPAEETLSAPASPIAIPPAMGPVEGEPEPSEPLGEEVEILPEREVVAGIAEVDEVPDMEVVDEVSEVEVEVAPEPDTETATQEKTAIDNEKKEKQSPRAKEKKPKKPQVREETGSSLFSTTTIVATAFIGASNKLFLRGEGPGLTWEEGVPMQFVEIGKWSWTTTDATGPLRLHVFKNDEEEDKAGVLTVEPGQRLDVRPEFGG